MPEQPAKAHYPEKPESEPARANSEKSAALRKLTAEEQMALYEKELKENDWGHRPC